MLSRETTPQGALVLTKSGRLKLGDNSLQTLWHNRPAKLVLIELFSLGVTAEVLRANIGSKSAISLQWGPVDPKFQVKGVAPTNHSSSQKSRLNYLWYGIKIWTDLFPFCHNSRVWRTDRILIVIPRLHYKQRGKNLGHLKNQTIFVVYKMTQKGIPYIKVFIVYQE